jgi:hypothetical protein
VYTFKSKVYSENPRCHSLYLLLSLNLLSQKGTVQDTTWYLLVEIHQNTLSHVHVWYEPKFRSLMLRKKTKTADVLTKYAEENTWISKRGT